METVLHGSRIFTILHTLKREGACTKEFLAVEPSGSILTLLDMGAYRPPPPPLFKGQIVKKPLGPKI